MNIHSKIFKYKEFKFKITINLNSKKDKNNVFHTIKVVEITRKVNYNISKDIKNEQLLETIILIINNIIKMLNNSKKDSNNIFIDKIISVNKLNKTINEKLIDLGFNNE